MSRVIPAPLLAMLKSTQLTSAILWRITKRDDSQILGTDHDEDVPITLGGPYDGLYMAASSITGTNLRATADMAVNNMEVSGATPSDGNIRTDINVAEIEGGLFADAEVEILLCDWQTPSKGVLLVQRGNLGDIGRDSDGNYSTEIRGLAERLRQVVVRTYSERCQVRNLGDTECKVDLEALRETGTIVTVTSRRRFSATISGSHAVKYFSLGVLRFETGANAGFEREIKMDDEGDVAGEVSLWDSMPFAIAPGDTFSLVPGCDRLINTCGVKYSNVVNFRGYGVFVEGVNKLLAGVI